MADTKKQQIGDPLAEAAQTGMLGARRPISSREEAPAAPPPSVPEPTTARPETGTIPSQLGRRPTTRERKKKTVLLEAPLSRWLDMRAASEQREMSDIVADALELYKKLNPEES